MKSFTKLAAATLVAGLCFSQQGSAASISQLIQNGSNNISDEDFEYLIDRTDDGVGQLTVGDSLRGSINFNTIGGTLIGRGSVNDEFSGVYQVMVASIGPLNPDGTAFVTFVPDPAFEAVFGDGAVLAMYNDNTQDYCGSFDDFAACNGINGGIDDGTAAGFGTAPSSADVSSGNYVTEEAFIDTATDGDLWGIVGFSGDPGTVLGEGIGGTIATNVLTAFAFTSGSAVGNVNGGLNLLATGPAFGSTTTINRVTPSVFGGPVDFVFSQQLRGVSDLETPFEISTNTNVSFNATVLPEPNTLALLGLTLVGVAGLRRRRNRG